MEPLVDCCFSLAVWPAALDMDAFLTLTPLALVATPLLLNLHATHITLVIDYQLFHSLLLR